MDNSTVTAKLEGELLLITQLELVTPTTVAGTLYGIAFTLFCLYVYSLAPRLQDKDQKRRAKFMLGYSSVIMLCELYNLVVNAWLTQDGYIKHGDYPGGPYVYIESNFHTKPAILVALTCQLAVDIMTSAIQTKIWRVWVIWSSTRYAKLIIVLPSLCFLTWTALNLRTLILEITLPIAEVLRRDTKTQSVEVAIQGATTLVCTTFISLFLIYQHWRQRKLIGQTHRSNGYMKIVAVLVESYALESIWLLIVAVLFNPVEIFFAETKQYIEIIAYLLVQYRVATGRAYESQGGRSNISSLNWNHSTQTSTQFGEPTAAGRRRASVSVQPEVDVLPVSHMA